METQWVTEQCAALLREPRQLAVPPARVLPAVPCDAAVAVPPRRAVPLIARALAWPAAQWPGAPLVDSQRAQVVARVRRATVKPPNLERARV